jgi:hypothetical protein
MTPIVAFAVLASTAAGISHAIAHHSATMFDSLRREVVKGRLVELRWVNPHVTLIVRGARKSGEAPGDWLMETTSPGNLTRIGGWRREAIKPGDEVEIVFHPLRESSKRHGLLQQLTLLATGDVFATNIRYRPQETAELD